MNCSRVPAHFSWCGGSLCHTFLLRCFTALRGSASWLRLLAPCLNAFSCFAELLWPFRESTLRASVTSFRHPCCGCRRLPDRISSCWVVPRNYSLVPSVLGPREIVEGLIFLLLSASQQVPWVHFISSRCEVLVELLQYGTQHLWAVRAGCCLAEVEHVVDIYDRESRSH